MGLKFKIIMAITILRIYGKRMAREVDMGEIGEIEKWIRCSVRERERTQTKGNLSNWEKIREIGSVSIFKITFLTETPLNGTTIKSCVVRK